MIKLKSKVTTPVILKPKVSTPLKEKPKALAPIKAKNKYEYWVKFDVLGEDAVRAKLEGGKYGSGRLDAAVEWLSTKEENQKREKKRDADLQRALKAAKSAQLSAGITAIAVIAIGTASLYFYFS